MKTTFRALFLLLAAVSAVPAQEILIPANANWQVLHITDGVDPATLDADGDFATTWTTGTDYDGPAFATAPAPFRYDAINWMTANAPANTVLAVPPTNARFTSYFRISFTAAADHPDIFARMLADDGAVIYLDGVEIKRLNMAETFGDEFTMLADDSVRTEDGIDTETAPIDVPLGTLTAGTHTLAVSLHNASATSSDLGLYLQLIAAVPPAPLMMVRDTGGAAVDIPLDGSPIGWQHSALRRGSWLMNGVATEATLNSTEADLSTVGAAHFAMTLYAHENSTGSNLEATDFFRARLEVVYDDDSTGELPLVAEEDDLSMDGSLSGDEMNPPGIDVGFYIYFARHLSTPIPASVKRARLVVSGVADSGSEFIRWGHARISLADPLADGDGDGVSLQDEYVAGTDPASAASVFRIGDAVLDRDGVGTDGFLVQGNTLAGVTYSVETGDTLESMDSLGTYTPAANGGGVRVTFTAYPEKFFARLRPMP